MNAPNVTAEQLMEVGDTFSEEMRDLILERADRAAANWLFVFGVPQTPAEVRQLVHSIYKGGPALLVSEGYLAVTEGNESTEEERAKLKEEREAQQSPLAQVRDLFSSASGQPSIGQGQYL